MLFSTGAIELAELAEAAVEVDSGVEMVRVAAFVPAPVTVTVPHPSPPPQAASVNKVATPNAICDWVRQGFSVSFFIFFLKIWDRF